MSDEREVAAARYVASIIRAGDSFVLAIRAARAHVRHGALFAKGGQGAAAVAARIFVQARKMADSSEREPRSIRKRAIDFAASKVAKSSDWQEVEQAIWNSDTYGPWIGAHPESDHLGLLQEIVREGEESAAEDGRMPAGYS